MSDDIDTLNLAEGVLRLLIFIGYVGAISLMKDIQRVFQYHGAEHKVINTFEANQPLTLENALKQTRIHPRCGTSFILIVLLISIIVFSFLGWPAWYWRILSRLLLLPVIAGISYEIIRLAGRQKDAGEDREGKDEVEGRPRRHRRRPRPEGGAVHGFAPFLGRHLGLRCTATGP